MSDPSPRPYRLDQLQAVPGHMRTLARRAAQRGLAKQYLSALRTIHDRLRADPLGWGDPEYHTILKGGTVRHAVCPPLFVHYVVYEHEHAVCILDMLPMPGTALEGDE